MQKHSKGALVSHVVLILYKLEAVVCGTIRLLRYDGTTIFLGPRLIFSTVLCPSSKKSQKYYAIVILSLSWQGDNKTDDIDYTTWEKSS